MSGTWNSMLGSINAGIGASLLIFDSEVQRPNAPYEFTLDDGTATIVITCSSRIRNRGDAELLKVGSIVTVIGKAQIQKYCRVVQCIGFNIHTDPTQEMVHALRVIQMRTFSFSQMGSNSRSASQLSLSSQGCHLRRRDYQSQAKPVASPAKPQDTGSNYSDMGTGSKRREPPTEENFDDSFLNATELDNMMNQIDKRQKIEPSSIISEDDNFGYSSQGTIQVGKHLAHQITSMISDRGTTLKELVLAGLDFLAVEDSLSYLISIGQIYERDGRYYLL